MPPKRKKTKTKTAQLTSAATRAAKTAANVSAEKTKEAVQFVYKHRKKIMDALELLAAVVGTASAVVGKPDKSKRRKKR